MKKVCKNNHPYVKLKLPRDGKKADLKTIYNAPIGEQAQNNLDIVADKWESKYPKLMSSWYSKWDAITPIFKFSVKVRTVIYTTNAVESVNLRLRSMNKKRSVFPNKVSLEKALYLAVEKIVKNVQEL